jgi:hypothetical protein
LTSKRELALNAKKWRVPMKMKIRVFTGDDKPTVGLAFFMPGVSQSLINIELGEPQARAFLESLKAAIDEKFGPVLLEFEPAAITKNDAEGI